MKNLRIPIKTEDSVDISEIERYYKGIIIGFKNSAAVGYIQSTGEGWVFQNNINDEDGSCYEDELLDLIKYLTSSNVCDSFKVIEFYNEDN